MNSLNQRGVVREFDTFRRRGTIQTDNGDCIPVRYSAIVGSGVRSLQSGDRVSFELEQTIRGVTAIRVSRD